MNNLPRLLRVEQKFPQPPPLDIAATIEREFAKFRPRLKPGANIAVGVGSRGISHLAEIAGAVIKQLRAAGTHPFIIPAMGSHGGATPEGQIDVLASYEVTEASMGVPIRGSLDVRQVGTSTDGVPVYCSTEALSADGIILINRIKPHTAFAGTLGSGLIKMSVIGLGKRAGAAAMHLSALQIGHERTLRGMANVILRHAPVLGGIGILENQFHETARLVAVPSEEMEAGEAALLAEARALMPLLPFEEIDLLIIDRIGKNVSGAGMDPNVTNRPAQGYSTSPMREGRPSPFIRRIFVRDLTPETHGNALGIGYADLTTTRLVRAMDVRITSINSLTALSPHSAKIPIHFDTDRECVERALASLPLSHPTAARIAWIADTLSLTDFHISEPLWSESKANSHLSTIGGPQEFQFDELGNLLG